MFPVLFWQRFCIHKIYAMMAYKLAPCLPRRFNRIGFCHGRHSCCVKRGPLNTPKEKHNAVLTRLLKIVAAIIPQRITSAKSIAASAPKTNIDV